MHAHLRMYTSVGRVKSRHGDSVFLRSEDNNSTRSDAVEYHHTPRRSKRAEGKRTKRSGSGTTYSNDGQDQWVLSAAKSDTPKVFLDIGARDGSFFSNTQRLEENGWTGTCVEPFPSNFESRKCTLARIDSNA